MDDLCSAAITGKPNSCRNTSNPMFSISAIPVLLGVDCYSLHTVTVPSPSLLQNTELVRHVPVTCSQPCAEQSQVPARANTLDIVVDH